MCRLLGAWSGKYLALLLLLFIIGPSATSMAQQEELEQVDVRGKVRREELQSTSATILDNKDISDRHYVTPADILKLSPGISIRQGNIFQSANPIRIRGFSGAHDYGGQVLMTVDGIPIHDGGHADGYIDSHIINPMEIESVGDHHLKAYQAW